MAFELFEFRIYNSIWSNPQYLYLFFTDKTNVACEKLMDVFWPFVKGNFHKTISKRRFSKDKVTHSKC